MCPARVSTILAHTFEWHHGGVMSAPRSEPRGRRNVVAGRVPSGRRGPSAVAGLPLRRSVVDQPGSCQEFAVSWAVSPWLLSRALARARFASSFDGEYQKAKPSLPLRNAVLC